MTKISTASALVFLVFGVSGLADQSTGGTAKILEKMLSQDISRDQAYFDRAGEIRAIVVDAKDEIDQAKCSELVQQIDSKYEISPFRVVYQGGDSSFYFCNPGGNGGWYKPEKFYFQPVSLTNQFGLPITHVLQSKARELSDEMLTTLYLDPSFKIVEISEIELVGVLPASKSQHFVIRAIDSAGNVYANEYDTQQPWSHQTFTSADGLIGPIEQLSKPYGPSTRTVRSWKMEVVKIYKRMIPDWQKVTTLISHAYNGSFYTYGTQLTADPHEYDWLSVYTLEGKQVCADGFTRRGDVITNFDASPSEATEGYCANDW